MNLELYKHIIFDFDDTLATLIVDWPFWHEQVIAVMKKHEANFDESTHLNMYSIHQYINKYGKKFRDDFVNFEIAFEQKYYHGYQLIEKSFALLQKLHDQEKFLYLLTSNCKEVVLPILKELGIASYFKKIVTINDVPNIKPTIEPFKLIAENSANKSEYLMIGDSSSDSGFAKNVGIAYLDIKDF